MTATTTVFSAYFRGEITSEIANGYGVQAFRGRKAAFFTGDL